MKKNIKARSVFISDTHLGSRQCQAENLLDFLKNIECERLYLVGDIIDGWYMKSKGIHWNSSMNSIVTKIIKLSKSIDVYYVVGNHDEFLRSVLPTNLGSLRIVNELVHVTPDGRRLLVTHGDLFDPIICNYKWLAKIGGRAYEWLITLNRVVNRFRRLFKLPYWSLSKYLKLKAKSVTGIIRNFETLLLDYAKGRGYDGVIAGHIHSPACGYPFGYYNCGDWVESCSALLEDKYGNIKIYYYK